jgi:type I restriction enzyme S subunit
MKDCQVEGIGNIPEGWNIKKLKDIGEFNSGGTPSRNKMEYWDNGNISWLSSGEVMNNIISTSNEKITELGLSRSAAKLFPKGTVLVAITGQGLTRGRTAVLAIDAATNQSVIGIIPKENIIDKYYLWYYLQSQYWNLRSLSQGSVQLGLNLKTLKSYPISLPINTDEQRKIVHFIKQETKHIDQIVEKKQKLIELLQLKRQTSIDQIVTQGLDQVQTKETGIKWVGKIPEHWKINKIKFTSYVKGRIGWQGLRSDEFTEEGPYLITGTEFKNGKVDWKNCYHVEMWRYEQDPYIRIKNSDVIITKDGTIGKVALIEDIPGPTTLNSGVMVVRPLQNLYLPRFMYWILQSKQFTQYVDYTKTGSTISHLYQETFENFTFSFPGSLDEQRQIFEYLEEKISKIDNIISQSQKLIKLFKEKRNAIISSAIGGNISIN